MNDDIINGIMQRGLVLKVLGGATAATRQAIGKHDLAQREALEKAVHILQRVAHQSVTEKQLLPSLISDVRAFLDIHAQAEQQEAPQGWAPCSPDLLKSGVCCESAPRIAGSPGSGVSHYHPAPQQEAQGAQAGDGLPRNLRSVLGMVLNALDRDAADGKPARGEMAAELRAALATQPAVPEPVAYCDDFTLGMLKSGQAYSVGVTPAAQRHEGESHALYVVPAAVRGAEHE